MTRDQRAATAILTIAAALGVASVFFEKRAVVQAAAVQAPRFEVDPLWPKPLPNHWIVGNVIGVSVDAQDHIWIVHRGAALERMETYAAATPPWRQIAARPLPARA